MIDPNASDEGETPVYRPPGHLGADPTPRRPSDPLPEHYRNPTYAAPTAPPAPRSPSPRAHGEAPRRIGRAPRGRRWLDRIWHWDAKMRPGTERLKAFMAVLSKVRWIVVLLFLTIAVLGYLFDPRTGLLSR